MNNIIKKDSFWSKQMEIFNKTVGARKMNKSQEEFHKKKAEYWKKYDYIGFENSEIIEIIESCNNVEEDNEEDNDTIIDYLKGNEDAIWSLFLKYKRSYLKLWYRMENKKISEITPDDIVIEIFLVLIKMIHFGRYKGISFVGWSHVIFKYKIIEYYRESSLSISEEKNKRLNKLKYGI